MHNNNDSAQNTTYCGFRGGGMTAAVTAADQGLKVLVVKRPTSTAELALPAAVSGSPTTIISAMGGNDSEELA